MLSVGRPLVGADAERRRGHHLRPGVVRLDAEDLRPGLLGDEHGDVPAGLPPHAGRRQCGREYPVACREWLRRSAGGGNHEQRGLVRIARHRRRRNRVGDEIAGRRDLRVVDRSQRHQIVDRHALRLTAHSASARTEATIRTRFQGFQRVPKGSRGFVLNAVPRFQLRCRTIGTAEKLKPLEHTLEPLEPLEPLELYFVVAINAGAAEIERPSAIPESSARGAFRWTRCRRCRCAPAVGETKSINGYGRAVTFSDTVPASITVPDSASSSYSTAVAVAVRLVNRMPAGPSPPARVHVREAGNRRSRGFVANGSTSSCGNAARRPQRVKERFRTGGQKGLRAHRVRMVRIAVVLKVVELEMRHRERQGASGA